MKQRQDEEKKRQVWHKERRHIHRNKKVQFIPSNEKLIVQASIQTFFSTLKLSFCYLYFIKQKTGTQNGIIKCIFFTHNYLRKLQRADPSSSFKLLMQHNSSPSQAQVARLKGYQQGLHSTSNPQGLKSQGTAKCCLTVLAKRKSTKEKG